MNEQDKNIKQQDDEAIGQRICELMSLHPDAEGSLVEQVAKILRGSISSGELPAGTKMPTQRALSQIVGISRRTISFVYDLLQKEGYLVSRQGSGTWVAGAGEQPVLRLPKAAHSMDTSLRHISFTMANLPAMPMVEECIKNINPLELSALLSGNGYETFGFGRLREEIASYYTCHGLPTKKEEILITNGAQQAIMLIARHFLDHGSRVALEDPTYSGAIDAFRLAGADLISMGADAGHMDVDKFEKLMEQTRPQLVYIIPVHNPTGVFMSDAFRGAVSEICGRYGVTIVEDRSLENIVFKGPAPETLGKLPAGAPLITIGSASKVFWGGLRVGWIRAQRADIQKLARLKSVEDLGGSLLSQYVASRLLLQMDEASAFVHGIITSRLKSFTRLLGLYLPDWEWTQPDGGYSLWVKLPEKVATGFSTFAEKFGVSVIPGPLMSCQKGFEDHLRLSFVLPEKEAEEGIRRLADAWAVFSQNTEKHLGSIIAI